MEEKSGEFITAEQVSSFDHNGQFHDAGGSDFQESSRSCPTDSDSCLQNNDERSVLPTDLSKLQLEGICKDNCGCTSQDISNRCSGKFQGGNFEVISDLSLPVNSRCMVTSSQDLAHILVAGTTHSILHSLDQQISTESVSACAPQQTQTIGTIANVVTSNQQIARGTILAQSVLQISLPQQSVLNSSMSDVLLRLSSSAGTGGALPLLVVQESSAGLVPSSDVMKSHSYSLVSSAVPALSSSGAMQKVVKSTPGQRIQAVGLPHKAMSANSIANIMSPLSTVNKLLSGLIIFEDKDKVIKKKKIMDHCRRKLSLIQSKYYNQQAEYFFLKNGGNIMDYTDWKKKFSAELVEYLRANRFDPYDDVNKECLAKWFFGVSSSGE